MPLTLLLPDVLRHIFSFLDLTSLHNLSLVCHQLSVISNADSLWKRHAEWLGLSATENYKNAVRSYQKEHISFFSDHHDFKTPIDTFQAKAVLDAKLRDGPENIRLTCRLNGYIQFYSPETIRTFVEAGAKATLHTLHKALSFHEPLEVLNFLLTLKITPTAGTLHVALKNTAPSEVIKLLLDHGAIPLSIPYEHSTLRVALEYTFLTKTLEQLIDAGATPLDLHLNLAMGRRAPIEVIRLLLQRGANPINNQRWTNTLHVARVNDAPQNVVNLLVQAGAF